MEVKSRAVFATYILRCADGSLYTGWTTDVGKRVEQHNAKKGAKYTRSRLTKDAANAYRPCYLRSEDF